MDKTTMILILAAVVLFIAYMVRRGSRKNQGRKSGR
jgi:flagellar biogenesis protein FliO